MTKHMLTSALFAGFVVGLLAALLHFAFLEPQILLAERYESGELTHYQGVAAMDDHHSTAPANGIEAAPHVADDGHTHEQPVAEEEASPLMRHGLSVLFAAVIYVGYALVLVSGFAVAAHYGKRITVEQGLLWGLAGYIACQLAPALGLAPELPGTMAAALEARQLWWAGCALATAAGLGLLAFGKGAAPRVIAIALLVAPHVIGAPELEGFAGIAPPELAASFAARSLGVGLVAWVSLGGLLAWFWNRETV